MVSRRRSREASFSREASLSREANLSGEARLSRKASLSGEVSLRIKASRRTGITGTMDNRVPTASRAPRRIPSRTRSMLAPAATVLRSSPTRTIRPPRPRLRDGRGSDPAEAGRPNLINGVVQAELTEASAG